MVKISKSQLGLAPIITVLIVIGIIAVGVGIVYLYQSPKVVPGSETLQPSTNQPTTQPQATNWKIYRSTKAKFMFKYPSDWAIINEYSRKVGRKSIKDLLGLFGNTVKAQSITPPEGWEVIREGYYVTAAGVKANTYTVILAPAGYQPRGDDINRPSEPIIVLNEHQFNCYGEEWWTPEGKHIDFVFVDSPNFRWLPPYVKYTTLEGEEEISGTNYIATCSKDPKVLDVLDGIAKSFVAIRPVEKK